MPCSAVEVPLTNEELACRAQQGCADSIELLLRRFQTSVLHFLRQRVSASDAEDLTQETFLRAYENLHRYNRRWAFSTWLFTIARRVGINHRRRAQATNDSKAIEAATAAGPSPLDAALAGEGRAKLWDRVSALLTEEQATALWLYYVEEMPARDVAKVLGRSWTSVKVMLFRARKKLMPQLAEFDPRQPATAVLREIKRPQPPWAVELETPHV